MDPTPSDLGRIVHIDYNALMNGPWLDSNVIRALYIGTENLLVLRDDNGFTGNYTTLHPKYGPVPIHWEGECDGVW